MSANFCDIIEVGLNGVKCWRHRCRKILRPRHNVHWLSTGTGCGHVWSFCYLLGPLAGHRSHVIHNHWAGDSYRWGWRTVTLPADHRPLCGTV